MNPAWIPAICAVVGLIANYIWFKINVAKEAYLQTCKAEMLSGFSDMKDWISKNYVSEPMCKARRETRCDLVDLKGVALARG